MSTNIDELSAFLAEVENYKPRKAEEKTIFSICGKGYYENPASDLLAFFGNPNEEHGLGYLVLEALFSAAGIKNISDYELVSPPKREEITETGKRLDLVFEGAKWVLTVENKIHHYSNNDFKEYEKYIKKNYKAKGSYYFIILSPEKVTIEGWDPVTYKEFIKNIEDRFSSKYLSDATYKKWFLLFREFILTLKYETEECQMDFKTYDFIVEKYSKLIQAQELLNNYYLELAKQIKEFMCNNNKLTFSEGEVQINTELKPWYNIDLNGVKMDLKPIKIDFCKNKIYHFWYLLINPQGRMAFQYYVNYLPEYNKERIINEVRKKGYTKIYDTERNGKLISIIPVFEKYCTFEEAKKYAEEVLSVYKGIFDGLYNK